MKKTVKKAKRSKTAKEKYEKAYGIKLVDMDSPSDIYNAVAMALGEKLVEINSPKLPNPFDKI